LFDDDERERGREGEKERKGQARTTGERGGMVQGIEGLRDTGK